MRRLHELPEVLIRFWFSMILLIPLPVMGAALTVQNHKWGFDPWGVSDLSGQRSAHPRAWSVL